MVLAPLPHDPRPLPLAQEPLPRGAARTATGRHQRAGPPQAGQSVMPGDEGGGSGVINLYKIVTGEIHVKLILHRDLPVNITYVNSYSSDIHWEKCMFI